MKSFDENIINVTENEATVRECSAQECSAAVKKRRSRKDVFFLVMLSLLTVMAMCIVTARRGITSVPAETLPTISNNRYMATYAPETNADGTEITGYTQVSGDENGSDEMITLDDGTEMSVYSVFDNSKSTYTDENGVCHVVKDDGTSFSFGAKEKWAVQVVEVSIDDIMGTAPISVDDAVKKATESVKYTAKNRDYNPQTSQFGGNSERTPGTGYSYTWGGTLSCNDSCGKRGSCSANVLVGIYLADGTLRRAQVNGSGGLSFSMGSNHGGEDVKSTGRGPSYSFQQGNNSSSGTTSFRWFVYWTRSSDTGGKCDGASCSAWVQNPYVTLYHQYRTKPTVTINYNKTWAPSKTHTVKAYDPVYINYCHIWSSSGGNYVSSSIQATHQTTITTNGWIAVDADSCVGSSYDYYNVFYGSYLYIDSGQPSISDYFFSTNSGSNAVTSYTNAANMLMYVKASDSPGQGERSGIASIQIYNIDNGYSQTKTSGFTSPFTVPGAKANGRWRVTVKDQAGNSVQKDSYSFYLWDRSTPVVQVTAFAASSGATNTTVGSEIWTNKPVRVDIQITDTPQDDIKVQQKITSVHVLFGYNGNKYALFTGSTVTAAENGYNMRYPNYFSMNESTPGNGVHKVTASFYMPYDIKTLDSGTFKVLAYDRVNSGETSKQDYGKYRIDTIAPEVTSVTIDGKGNAESNYASENVTVKVQAIDRSISDNQAYYANSGKKYNNGSGISEYRFYTNSSCTTAIPVKVGNTWYNNGVYARSFAGGTLDTISVQIRWDSSYSSSNSVYVVVKDRVGNVSNGTGYKGTDNAYRYYAGNVTWENPYRKTSTSKGNYYIYMSSNKDTTYYRDTIKPQILVVNGTVGSNLADVASQIDVVTNNKDNLIAASNGYNGRSTKYKYEFSQAANQNFTIFVIHGGSGGTFTMTPQGGTKVTKSLGRYYYGDSNRRTYEISTTLNSSAAYGSISTSGEYTYSSYKCYVYQVTATAEGLIDYTIEYKNNAGISADKVTITTAMDRTAPSINLIGFSDNKIDTPQGLTTFKNNGNKLTATQLYKSEWWNTANGGSGLWAVFSVADGVSGLFSKKVDSYTYGISGTSITKYASNYSKTFKTISGSSTTATGDTGMYFGFSYTNSYGRTYTFDKYVGIYPEKYGSDWIVQVCMFSQADMRELKSGSYSFLSNNIWDVTTATSNSGRLYYKVGVTDFIGNIAYCHDNNSARPEASNTKTDVLRYNVDPFQVSAEMKFYTIPSGDWNKDLADVKGSDGKHLPLTQVCASRNIDLKTYNMSEKRSECWTRDDIIIEIVKYGGISPLTTQIKYEDLTGKFDTQDKAITKGSYNELTKLSDAALGCTEYPRVESTRVTSWYHIGNSTKNVQLGVAVLSGAYAFKTASDYNLAADQKESLREGNKIIAFSSSVISTKFIIKQDSTPPVIKYVKLTQDNLGQKDVLWFDAEEDISTKQYKFTLNESKSPALGSMVEEIVSNGQTHKWAWTTSELYVAIGVSDKPTKLDGSGVNTVWFNNIECSPRGDNSATTGEKLYVTNKTYGYTNRNTSTKYDIVTVDNIGNRSSTAKYGDVDAKYNKMFTVVDKVDPYIRLTGTNQDNYAVPTTQAINQDNPHSNTILALCGEPTRNRTLTLTISYEMGISGMKFYLRERPEGEYFVDFNNDLAAANSDYIYKYFGREITALDYYTIKLDSTMSGADPKWGYYDKNSVWHDGEVVPGGLLNSPVNSTGAKQTGSTTISIDVASVRSRFDLIAVTGSRKYYLIELGDVFIDTEQPIINSDLTVFSVASEDDTPVLEGGDNVVDYTKLQHIWTNEVGYQYTNGSIYIYYHISDTASGVDDNKVLYGADDQVLEKVLLKNLPVWEVSVNGEKAVYYFRKYAHEANPTIGKTTVNGVVMMTFNGTTTQYKYPGDGNYVVSSTTINDYYYRLKVDNGGKYVITAMDKAKNGPTYSKEYNVNIDTTDIQFTSRMTSGGVAYSGVTFTNKDVNVIWTVTYGNSGFDGIEYDVEDKYNNGLGTSVFRECKVNIPSLSIDENGYLVVTHFTNGGTACPDPANCTECYNSEYKRVVTKLSGGSYGQNFKYSAGTYKNTVTVKVVGNKFYWFIDGKNTYIEVNQSYYGSGSELLKMTFVTERLALGSGKVTCSFKISDPNAWYVYSLKAYNGVVEAYSKEVLVDINGTQTLKKIRPYKESESIVKIDRVAPIIDLNSGNYAELASTKNWHAMPRSLRINVSDALSGIGKTPLRKEDGTYLPTAQIDYVDREGNNRTVYLNKDDDDYFRAYDIERASSGDEYYQKLSLHFFDYCTEYTIKITDEAGNITTQKFKPLIDTYSTRIETMSIYKLDGTKYYVYSEARGNATQWVNDVAKRKVNWSDTPLYIEFEISYGESGYILQCVEDYYPDDLGLDTTKWYNVSYTVKNTKSIDGGYRDTIRVNVADSSLVTYLYTFRKYRALSKAQYAEIGVRLKEIEHDKNKHSLGQAEIDSDHNGKCDTCGACMNHNEANADGNGICKTCKTTIWDYIYKSYTSDSLPRGTENAITRQISVELEEYEKYAIYGSDISGIAYYNINLSEAKSTGLIAIDKSTPTVTPNLLKSDDRDKSLTEWSNYGTYQSADKAYKIEDGDWWKAYVRMSLNLSSESDFASGVVYYYRYYDNGEWSDWVLYDPSTNALYVKTGSKWTFFSNDLSAFNFYSQERRHESDTSGLTKISSYSAAFAYILSKSQNNTVYEMKAETGAGKVTDTYRFGYINGSNKIYGIKIDINTPSVNANGAKTYTTYSGTPNQETLRQEYVAEGTSSYVVTVDAKYTSYNTVLVSLAIENIGYSGVTVKYRDGLLGDYKVMFTISYSEYTSYIKANGGSAIYKYFHLTKNGETIRNIRIDTNAGKQSEVKQVYIRIDNTTPIVYVSDIQGEKASNWGWTDYNLYNKVKPEFWYVSELVLSMSVGVIENNSFANITPYSGYTIEYTTDFVKGADGQYVYGTAEDTWKTLSDKEMLLRGNGTNIINGDTYRFRITSGAGLVYYLGEEVFNNRGKITYSKDNLVGQIKTATAVNPIEGHVSNGATGDYDDGSYLYSFYVDSNKYSYSYSGQVYLGQSPVLSEKYDGRLTDFADYEVWVYDSNHVPHKLPVNELDKKFSRGDIIEIRYTSKWDERINSLSTAQHNYFQDYTVSKVENGRSETYCEDADNEKEGKLAVQFENGKIDIISYFIAEVEVEYGEDVFYLQTNPSETKTTGVAYYNTPLAYGGKLSIELEYTYYRYNFDALNNKDKIYTADGKLNSVKINNPSTVGAYYVVVKVKDGFGSFRVTNKNSVNTATDRKDFVIKYFEKFYDGTDSMYYEIANRTDFNNIDGDYFDILENNVGMSRTLETAVGGKVARKTYLSARYKLINDIDVLAEDAIEGNFTGEFDGDEFTVTVYDENSNLRTDKETCDNHADGSDGICDDCGECVLHIDSDHDDICDVCKHCMNHHIDYDGICDDCGYHVGHIDGDGVCNVCGECITHIDVDHNGKCDRCNECIEHVDRDNLCDKCGSCIHVDADNNLICDICGKCIVHKDNDSNGICDICSNCTLHVDANNDDVCDKLGCRQCIVHIDSNNDGICDRENCKLCVNAHIDVKGNDICNVCGECIEHKDSDNNSICDRCAECIEHKDSDSVCDRITCGKCITHTDKNNDGVCDICMGCAHKQINANGRCVSCSECINHSDSNKDGRCDNCAKCIHSDIDNNRYCDKCGECLHVDVVGDGKCNVCGYCSGEHVDADGICDVCGYCAHHVDADGNGKCDICGFCTEHKDENADGKCDVCGYCAHGHTDERGDYVCDKCKNCTHKDSDNDKLCDICGECMEHVDADGNGKCDICGKCIIHTDSVTDNICDECGYCTIAHVDTNSDEYCDICGKSLRSRYENWLTRKYGLFGNIMGKVEDINVRYDGTVIVNARDNSEIGLLATEINGTVNNVTIITDVVIESLNGGKFGGLAAKTGSNAKIGLSKPVYTDVRITNNGNKIVGADISAFIGYIGLGTQIDGTYIFGENEIYNVTDTNIGMVYGDADAGSYDFKNSSYFARNAFLNGNTVNGMSSGNAIGTSGITGISYEDFIGNTALTVAKTNVYNSILDRLYSDFGYVYGDVDNGLGTADNPLIINSYEHILAINGYMNLSFEIVENQEIDMSAYKPSVAVTKVFNGNLSTTGGYVLLKNFASDMTELDAKYEGYNGLFGLFGQLNGSVSNLVFNGIDIDYTYVGDETLYSGIIAGKSYEEAEFENIILIGKNTIRVGSQRVMAGGLVGYAKQSDITDIYTINNVTVVGGNVIAGGLVGKGENIKLPNTDVEGVVIVAGRTVARSDSMAVGAVMGDGTINGTTAKSVYAYIENAYAGELLLESRPIGSVAANEYQIKMVTFTDSEVAMARFASNPGISIYDTVFGNAGTDGYYPLEGRGTSSNPFIVSNESEFKLIDLALYANYSIVNDITFTDFETIGQGLHFTGEINGSAGENISAEESGIAILKGLTAPLVYYNAGSITSLSLNVIVEETVKSGETFYYGGVAIYSDGIIKNVTVSGTVDIVSEENNTTLYVSGFVAVSYGGIIEAELSKIQNSISALDINVKYGGTVYTGGYAAVVKEGEAKFSYGIATGTIDVDNANKTYAGLLVGYSYGTCSWEIGESASVEYTYTITVDGVTIPKVDEITEEPLEENFVGIEFGN